LKIFEVSLGDLKGRESPRNSKEQHLSEIDIFCNIKQYGSKVWSHYEFFFFYNFLGERKTNLYFYSSRI